MSESVHAWQPGVPAVREVLHATFREHAYPAHTHDAWTILLIDEGAVAYDLGRASHIADPSSLTILPPHVPHDGKTAREEQSFRKRVLYLETEWMPREAIGAAVYRPTVVDTRATTAVRLAHARLEHGDALAAESAIAVLREALLAHLGGEARLPVASALAPRLRELLDAQLTAPLTLAEAGRLLGAHPSHLVRAFSAAYGIAPHRYVTGRRVDLARRLLLTGMPPAEVATTVGFHDQSHLTRHFRRVLGSTPAAFAA